MEKKREKKAPTTQPCEAPRTCLCAAHHEGEERPGGMPVGVVGVEMGACPLPAYDGNSYITNARRGRHDARRIRQSDFTQRHPHPFQGCCGRTKRHHGTRMGLCPISVRQSRQTRARDCIAANVHGAGRRDTSTTRSRGIAWYGSRTHTCTKEAKSGSSPWFIKGNVTSADRKSSLVRWLGHDRDTSLRMGGLLLSQSNRLRACSQIGPVHIWPQLFASDRTGCLAVDDDADLSGNPALRITPKPNCLGSYAHDLRELGVTTLQINRALDVIHARNSTLVEQQIYNRVRG